MPRRLKESLRTAGATSNKAWEALNAEVSYLVRVFASLAEDPGPSVHLALERAPSFSPSASLTLVCSFAADTAVIARGPFEDPAELIPATSRDRLTLWLTSDRVPRPHPGKDLGLRSATEMEVVLASMPFGIVGQPSLALGLLKSTLPSGTAKVLYFTIPFARRIGLLTYMWIAELQPYFTAVLGEWLFGSLLAPGSAEVRRYLDEILLEPTARWLADSTEEPGAIVPVPQGMVADLLRIREAADVFLDDCVDEILALRPKIVGLTSVFQQQTASLALARRLKARAPEVAVVLGGYNCEGPMGLATVRQFDCLDAVVSGEGDVVFPLLVERLLAGQPLDGLGGVYTRTSPEVVGRSTQPPNAPSPHHLDDLPYPDFDDFFAQYEASGLGRMLPPKLILETARGCWWGAKQHCTFCGLNGSTMAFRSKSPERALAEIRTLSARHPGLFIDVADNILDMRYFGTLLPRLAEERLGLRMFYEVKANLRKDQVRQLREAGVVAIQPGIESLSDEVLRIMRKGVSALQNIQLLKWCAELGVAPYWNLIWGFPGEPPEEYERMAELLPLLHHLPPPCGLSRIFLERFSPNFFDSEALGFTDVRPAASYEHIYPTAADDLGDLAYFFEYGYQDRRMSAPYTRPLLRRAVEWQEAHAKSRLVAFDLSDRLMLMDSRRIAAQPLGTIEGLARDLYLACDGIRTIDQLCRVAASQTGREAARAAVEETLQPLVASGYIVRQGDAVLALATPGRLGDTPTGAQPLSQQIS
ncbi:MAG TPA: RiPP maturation radical SAM C-methyltransferase [Thermoanaerobaculia bacterium]|nr:RiPP maturation radical SAM C-methyltransferase [Thermoanaerobaculia bacterium]